MDDTWKVDLEIALLEDADLSRIRSICANRPLPPNSRPSVWRACLAPELRPTEMVNFDETFRLPNQDQLHSDCERAATELASALNAHHSLQETPPGSMWSASDLDDDDDDDNLILPNSHESDSDQTATSVEKLTSELESCLTNFARVHSLPYKHEEGWVSIIHVLYSVLKPVDRYDLYGCFVAVCRRFIPIQTQVSSHLSGAFRLMLQYHEPKLCSLMDSLKLDPDVYATIWFRSLFTRANLTEETLLSLWDAYFLVSDPLLGLFITLVLLVNAKPNFFPETATVQSGDGSVLSAETQSTLSPNPQKLERDDVLHVLLDLPKPMQPDDIVPLLELAQFFAKRTPTLFRTRALSLLFGNATPNTAERLFTDSLCLYVSAEEILQSHQIIRKSDANRPADAVEEELLKSNLRYLLVDCRPAEQYNAGHLPTAFFLDSELMLTDPALFQNAVTALLQAQHRAINAGSQVAGEHIALLDAGCSTANRITDMVAAVFLRLHTPYVSLVEGGYMALHCLLKPYGVDRGLSSHDSNRCFCCLDESSTESSTEVVQSFNTAKPLISRLTTAITGTTVPVSTSKHHPVKALTGLLNRFSGKLSVMYNSPTKRDSKQTTPSVKSPEGARLVSKGMKNMVNPPNDSPLSFLSEVPPDKPMSYRNTTSVFSIDDDVDEEDLDPTGLVSSADDFPRSQNDSFVHTSKRPHWLNRWYAPPGQDNKTFPPGDIPERPGGLDSSEPGDLLDISQWSHRPEVRGVFECRFVDPSGRIADSGYLVLVERHLLLLSSHDRRPSERLFASLESAINSVLPIRSSLSPISVSPRASPIKRAVVLRSIHLALITRITSNKRIPECITFHYSATDPTELLLLNGQTMGVRDRLYIPQAGEAVRMIKMAVFNTTQTYAAA
ncbi:unnamed protein product [Dicrocoelium dendriticum]|nr:unnamed protein product [Dicrocoelium dendriticum]